jgi:deoxyribodipyrimidine photo-lyase
MLASILWFRQDLRIHNNPALLAAVERGEILPIYILDSDNADNHMVEGAAKIWLHHSLISLNQSLSGNLQFFKGDPQRIISTLIDQYDITSVFWNRCYEPWQVKRDSRMKDVLEARGIQAKSYNASMLWEPWEVLKKDGTPYQVFTPFYKNGCLRAVPPRQTIDPPKCFSFLSASVKTGVDDLNLLEGASWQAKLQEHCHAGEAAALASMEIFFQERLRGYVEYRDYPAQANTSHLSIALHFGEISPHRIWYAVKDYCQQHLELTDSAEQFLRQLIWREFCYSLMFHFPSLPHSNWRAKFDDFPWEFDQNVLSAWQQGKTGYPLIDAGMRELWQTGFMHNRVRMIVGSFLVKNCLHDWRHGAAWFWQCLFDADLANNTQGWQWVAGCGFDAAPFFRIFNPVTQAKKFDPEGEYIRRYVPEIAQLPLRYLFCPWEAPKEILRSSGVILGEDYPAPIVNLKQSRQRALAAYAMISK